MLVLSRKVGESIMIGNQIELKVIAIEGDRVKVGIIAPKSLKVHRTEVYEAIQEQNKEALNTEDAMKLLKQLKK